MDTMEKVVTLLSEQLGVDKDKINAGSDVVKDLGADSIDVVQLLMAMEDEFGVTVTEDDASNLKTVEDIVSLIDNRK
ncbi:MAG: acyl carrier protein [Clostridia bacterium]|nr:acyl carrier protein [Clostridia bacterium]